MDEDLKVEKIEVREMQNNPMVFEERVHEKINALLEKYGWTANLSKLVFDGDTHHLIINAHKKK